MRSLGGKRTTYIPLGLLSRQGILSHGLPFPWPASWSRAGAERWGMNSRFSSGWQILKRGILREVSMWAFPSHLGVGRDEASQEFWEALEFPRAPILEDNHWPLGTRRAM